jgi:hypothetical protein
MTHTGLSQGRPPDPSSLRRAPGPLRWMLSPLDYRTHVLADGDQPMGVVKARCGAAGGLPRPRSSNGPAMPAM